MSHCRSVSSGSIPVAASEPGRQVLHPGPAPAYLDELAGHPGHGLVEQRLLRRLNPVLRGWTNYFRHGVSSATFDDLDHFAWLRVIRWLRHKHDRVSWKLLRHRYLPRWLPTDGPITMFRAGEVATVRYLYRGTRIETPWTSTVKASTA
ncbi:hypothetical protein BH20ACT1_BH20ACT1_09730 [soil metagenome]